MMSISLTSEYDVGSSGEKQSLLNPQAQVRRTDFPLICEAQASPEHYSKGLTHFLFGSSSRGFLTGGGRFRFDVGLGGRDLRFATLSSAAMFFR